MNVKRFVEKDNGIINDIQKVMKVIEGQQKKMNNKEAKGVMFMAWNKLLSAVELIGSAEDFEFQGIDIKKFIK